MVSFRFECRLSSDAGLACDIIVNVGMEFYLRYITNMKRNFEFTPNPTRRHRRRTATNSPSEPLQWSFTYKSRRQREIFHMAHVRWRCGLFCARSHKRAWFAPSGPIATAARSYLRRVYAGRACAVYPRTRTLPIRPTIV
ncbi:unnamed protein product [Leptosia nina]|uniref:Uncharacterized protein n=1 Tax=Leptosia nina TaxID=320188 RepID=A0AAV1J5M2_9NEOP